MWRSITRLRIFGLWASSLAVSYTHLLVPRDPKFRHAEGNSDSHIKTALCGSSETIWIENGQLMLGRWQVIFFAEFDGPRRRELRVKIVADASA